MLSNRYKRSITCCYLYIITQHGYPPPAADTIEYLRQMKAMGFTSVELEGIREEHLMEVYHQRTEIKKTIDELELEVPYFCAVLPGLGSVDQAERKANLKLFRKGCGIASLLGSKGILDNAPLPPYRFAADIPVVRHYDEDVVLSAGLPKELDWKKYWNELVDTYREACDIASEYALTYQMHPAAGVLSATTDAFLYFAQAVDRPNLRFNLDTANQFFLKDNLTLSLIRLADYIDYIHLSDNRGQHVEHLVPGDGSINWPQFFETLTAIGFKGHYGIDVGGDESSIDDIHIAYQRTAQWLEKNMADYKL
jgi:sugar phosphate isomerase/epimerase